MDPSPELRSAFVDAAAGLPSGSWQPWLLPLLIAVPLLGAALLAAVGGRAGDRLARVLAMAVPLVTLGLTVAAAAAYATAVPAPMRLRTDLAWIPALDVRFQLGVDGISLPLLLLTAVLVCCCIPLLRRGGRGLTALVLLLEAGMLGTFVALDLVLFFVCFETVLVPMYLIIAYWGGEGRRPAATKFVLYTLVGSVLMLAGFLVVYQSAATFDLVELAGRHGAGLSTTTQLVAFTAIALGLAIKTPMWPLHTWLPDAHTAAPTVGSVLLAGVLLKTGSYGLIRIAVPVLPDAARAAAPYLGALAVAGIVYAALACLVQSDLKRVIAYSSVGHMGFVLLGIAALTPTGLTGALYANLAHGVITGLLFLLVGAVKDRHHTTDLDQLGAGLYQRAPRLGALLAFTAVASLGLPGLAGFWGEFLALHGAFAPAAGLDRTAFWSYLVLAGLGLVLTAAYLLRLVGRVCMGVADQRWSVGVPDLTVREALAWSPLVLAVVVGGLWPTELVDLTAPAVTALLGAGR